MVQQASLFQISRYYVTVIDGRRVGFLLGPYETHAEALANVERGKNLALKSDNASRSWFYAYGTTKTTNLIAKTVFGV